MRCILGPDVPARPSEGIEHDSGCIDLGYIPMFGEGVTGFDVDSEPILEQVQKSINLLDAGKAEAIARIGDEGRNEVQREIF